MSLAGDEAALSAVVSRPPVLDLSALPADLEACGIREYLTSEVPVASAAGFVKDPTAWQNMDLASYVQTEAGRDNTWPFLVGAL